jgi:hypothetical protein
MSRPLLAARAMIVRSVLGRSAGLSRVTQIGGEDLA